MSGRGFYSQEAKIARAARVFRQRQSLYLQALQRSQAAAAQARQLAADARRQQLRTRRAWRRLAKMQKDARVEAAAHGYASP